MLHHILRGASLLASLGLAAQPSAPKPVHAPMRDLPWGQLNFLATTDTHGWHGGHLQEAQYAGDWGDYISFAARMRELADKQGVDLLLVDSGDKVDGNGLYDGSSPKGKYTYDIFKEQHIDVICTGNHELYLADTAEREFTKTVPNFKDSYLASNVDIIDPKSGDRVPLARRYRMFTTKNQGIRVLAFGFLFDFTGNANNTFVQPVDDTVKEEWFQEAIRKDVDIFVVVGHIDLRSLEYKAIYTTIRKQRWDIPIQFFGGHSHIRNFMKYDSKAYALESGRYMETIGWMSIEGISGGAKSQDPELVDMTASPNFKRRYIDNNLSGYYHHTGLNESTFPTKTGQEVSETIRKARTAMDLDARFGCAPRDYFLNRAEYPGVTSILSLLDGQVLPDIFAGDKRAPQPRLVIINSGCIRFDVFEGHFTRDTVLTISPFANRFKYIKDVPYSAAKSLLPSLNRGGPVFRSAGLDDRVLAPPEQIGIKEDDELRGFREENLIPSGQVPFSSHVDVEDPEPGLLPGYTTKDDDGDDGDDTLHSPISFYKVPNCVQSEIDFPEKGEPETVELIFLDFVQPWILLVLRLLGHKYEPSDALPYGTNETFTETLEGWVKEHWPGDC